MKKHRPFIYLAAVLLLTGCVGLEEVSKSAAQTSSNTTSTVTVQPTANQLSTSFYRSLIVDGHYEVSQSRGVTLSLNSGYNLKNFEVGLMDLSKQVFPTSQYYFREGQIITTQTTTEWISRKSAENEEGLNPEGTGPLYLAQILEQDYMIQTSDSYELGGISIGLAMNAFVSNDSGQQVAIDDATLEAQAKQMANTILERLRQNSDLRNVPIVMGIFKQAAQDDLAGGSFILTATSVEGTAISNWNEVRQTVSALPRLSGDATEESMTFDNFKNEVQNIFPNLAGVTGRVWYSDGVASRMVIHIHTQFYGESEIIALTQHVTDVSNKFLSSRIPVEIRISSSNGTEAFLKRDASSGVFVYHIFD